MATKVNWKATVTGSHYTLWVRSGPGISYQGLAIIRSGAQLTITQVQGNWVHHQSGWSPMKDGNLSLMSITDLGSKSTSVTQSSGSSSSSSSSYTPTEYAAYSNSFVKLSSIADNDPVANDFINNVRGIHGMPYQFMPSVDRRIGSSNFGRIYSDKIISRMPLLLVTPGKPKFMKGFSNDEKSDIFKALASGADSSIDDLLKREGRYYDLEFNYKDYYDYVNPMCQMCATFLGIGDKVIDGTKLSAYQWQHWTNKAFTNFISSAETVAFYLDSENQISESFSNNTTESQLASKANALSDMGRELQFILGEGAGITFDKINQENYDATLKEFNDFSDKYLKLAPDTLIKRLSSGFLTVATGGKMIFPEIWSDSSFSKSYSVNIKLVTPYTDNFSWYMNILVPILHLIGLCAPQQMGANAYKSPFLVRAFYKGFFNVDMGIITSLNISKGAECKWTLNGLPTEVTVDMEIKDLYQVLTITKQSDITHLMNNTALMDYLANMCGININKPEILRQLEIYVQQIWNSKGISGRLGRGFLSLQQAIENNLNDVFSIFK